MPSHLTIIIIASLLIAIGAITGIYARSRIGKKQRRERYARALSQMMSFEQRRDTLQADDRGNCQAPKSLLPPITINLRQATAALNATADLEMCGQSSEHELACAESYLGRAEGLLQALEIGVYPLISRWRVADANLFDAILPLLGYLLMDIERNSPALRPTNAAIALLEARHTAATKPRIALEMLTAICKSLHPACEQYQKRASISSTDK